MKIYTSLAASLLLATPAFAADLLEPRRVTQAPVLQAPAPLSWTGLYAGAHLGAGFADWDRNTNFLFIDCGPCAGGQNRAAGFAGPSGDDTAILGGLQGGYNWQSGSLVLGVEADWSLTGLNRRDTYNLPSGALIAAGLGAITDSPDGFASAWRSDIDWLATARGRVGISTGNLLFYGTGGLAFADVSTRVNYLSYMPAQSASLVPVTATDDSVRVGWTIGAGVEAALSNTLSLKLEYLYADLGRNRKHLGTYIDEPSRLLQTVGSDEKITLHTVKLGVNYRFPTY